jgi:hypothetical protein
MQGIQFEACGKSLRLRFDFNALAALEDETGLSIDQVGQLLQPEDGSAPRVKNLRLLFWAGLGAKCTKDEAGEIMSDLGFQGAADLIVRAFVAAFPEIADAVTEAAPGNGQGAAA